jgi:hypothetical protein
LAAERLNPGLTPSLPPFPLTQAPHTHTHLYRPSLTGLCLHCLASSTRRYPASRQPPPRTGSDGCALLTPHPTLLQPPPHPLSPGRFDATLPRASRRRCAGQALGPAGPAPPLASSSRRFTASRRRCLALGPPARRAAAPALSCRRAARKCAAPSPPPHSLLSSLPLRCLAPVAAAVPGRRLILLDCFRTIFSCMSRSTRVSCIRPPWDLAYGEVTRFTHYFSDLQQLSYNFKFSQTAQVALIYKMTPCTLLTRAAIQS